MSFFNYCFSDYPNFFSCTYPFSYENLFDSDDSFHNSDDRFHDQTIFHGRAHSINYLCLIHEDVP